MVFTFELALERMQAAKGHLVETAYEFAIRSQSQEMGKNKC